MVIVLSSSCIVSMIAIVDNTNSYSSSAASSSLQITIILEYSMC
jgi:hypothetical protein